MATAADSKDVQLCLLLYHTKETLTPELAATYKEPVLYVAACTQMCLYRC